VTVSPPSGGNPGRRVARAGAGPRSPCDGPLRETAGERRRARLRRALVLEVSPSCSVGTRTSVRRVRRSARRRNRRRSGPRASAFFMQQRQRVVRREGRPAANPRAARRSLPGHPCASCRNGPNRPMRTTTSAGLLRVTCGSTVTITGVVGFLSSSERVTAGASPSLFPGLTPVEGSHEVESGVTLGRLARVWSEVTTSISAVKPTST